MLRTLSWVAGLLALGLVLTQATAAPRPQGQRVITVQNAEDNFQRPPNGSLRDVIERRALAGDIIRFAGPFVVQLKDTLIIPERLAGIRIEGPAGIAGPNRRGAVLEVRAPNTTLTGLTFQRILLIVGSRQGGTDGVRIQNNRFQDDSPLDLQGNGILLEGNEISNIRRRATPAIRLDATRDAVVRGNTVSGRVTTALSDANGVNVTVENNSFNGAVSGEFRSGVIRKNQLPEHSLTLYKLDVDGGIPHGRVVVDQNTVQRITAQRGNAEITGNTVSLSPGGRGTAGIRVITELRPLGAGPCLVSGNTVKGGFIGISVAQQPGADPVVVRGNRIEGSSAIGLSVTGAALQVVDNLVENAGGGVRTGSGIKLGVLGSEFHVQGNTVRTSRRGILVQTGTAQHRVRLQGNAVTDSPLRGIEVQKGAGKVDLENNTVRGCYFGISYFAGRGEVVGGEVTGSRGAGIFVGPGCRVRISRVVLGGNGGVGIDLAPDGVTPNERRKAGNGDLDWPEDLEFDGSSGKLTGRTIPGGLVEVYGVETGDRTGNPANGEGVQYLGTATADREGRFAWPESGAAQCPPSEKFTLTVTSPGTNPVTSEFSPDVECVRTGFTERVSVSSSGSQTATGSSSLGLVGAPHRMATPDGRFVVFLSDSPDLVPGDTNGATDVFVRDRQNGLTERVSVSSAGAEALLVGEGGNLACYEPAISADGRWVVFASTANNLVEGDVNRSGDVFLRDRENGVTIAVTDPTEQVPPLPNGSDNHLGGYYCTISGDGRFVAFVSQDPYWVPNDTNNADDVFVYTVETGTIERVSVATGGGQGSGGVAGGGLWPRLSHDGRFVVFGSALGNLTGDVLTRRGQIYLRDRLGGTTELVSKSGTDVAANRLATVATLSDDGRFVAFTSEAGNLVPGDTDGVSDIFVRDRMLGTTTLVSVAPDDANFAGGCFSPSLSADGLSVAFQAPGGHVFPDGPTILFPDLYLRDLVTGRTEEISVGAFGDADDSSGFPCLVGDGRYVVFQSLATNLVEGDTNDAADVFFRDRGESGIMRKVSPKRRRPAFPGAGR